jgi:cysteine desulfurase/selenocysteine lyase
MNLQAFKDQFSQGSAIIHFNNSGQAPIPDCNRMKAHQWIDRFYSEAAFCSNEGWEEVEAVRVKLARFIGADTKEVSFFQTTASALSQAAFSIPLKPNDEILTWDQEYPSNFYPWRIAAERAGAKLIQLPSSDYLTPVETILNAINEKTKVITISWVQFMTGAVTDLKQLSAAIKDRDIWLVADIIQGVGVRPFNFHETEFDIVCSGSHKWLCSNYGAAFMAVKGSRLNEMIPIEFGAMTFGTPDTPKSFTRPIKKTGHRFEPGSKSMIEIIAMGETLDLFEKVGLENIFQEANRLGTKLCAGLQKSGVKVYLPHQGPIVNFSTGSIEKDHALAGLLAKKKISYALRGPGIRLSVHAFNTDAEIEECLKVVASSNPRVSDDLDFKV